MRVFVRLSALLALWALAACRDGPPPRPAPEGTTRGFILLSIDTLRADHLGVYGYGRETSPFLDELAARGLLFERAFAQLPGTLPSHMSIFTGLYPAQHGVYPPEGVLSPEVPTLPETLRAAGYRTAGFTEGGYMNGAYGFARGFDVFADPDRAVGDPSAVEKTFGRGLRFLDDVGSDERFFLFLHTYSVHDPYEPPADYRDLFWKGPTPDTFAPTGPNLVEVNRGRRPRPDPTAVEYYVALYDAGIRYLDDQLRAFVEEIEARGLSDELTLVITSDHGEEFLEHGKLVHEQIYRETVHVPLVVVAPGVGPGRTAALVESIDIAPTILELAGVPPAGPMAGRSLVHLLADPGRAHRPEAYSEAFVEPTKGIFVADGGALWHALVTERSQTQRDYWVEREVLFDVLEPAVELRLHSYHEPRTVEVEVDGRVVEALELEADGWRTWAADLGAGVHRIRLSTDGCTSPSEIGASEDPRCLGFKVGGAELRRWELYELARDPAEGRDLSRDEAGRLERLAKRLLELTWAPVAAPENRDLPADLREQLEALGYLQ